MKHGNRNVKIRGAKSCKPNGLKDKKVLLVMHLLSYFVESRFLFLYIQEELLWKISEI